MAARKKYLPLTYRMNEKPKLQKKGFGSSSDLIEGSLFFAVLVLSVICERLEVFDILKLGVEVDPIFFFFFFGPLFGVVSSNSCP